MFLNFLDLYKQSIAQVPAIIDLLSESQYELVTAAECIGDKNPYQGESTSSAQDESINGASLPQASSSDAAPAQPNSVPAQSNTASAQPNPSTVQHNAAAAQPNASPVASAKVQVANAASAASAPSFIPLALVTSCLFSLISSSL